MQIITKVFDKIRIYKAQISRSFSLLYCCRLTLQCGVRSAARHGENISCSGVTSAARHGARSHSFVYISTTLGAKVIGLLRACS